MPTPYEIALIDSLLHDLNLSDKYQEIIRQGLFDRQRAVLEDKSSQITINCSRRGGKTHLLVRLLLAVATARKGANCLYCTETKAHSRELIWGTDAKANVVDVARQCGLQVRPHNSFLELILPEFGSKIRLGGLADKAQAEANRGSFFDIIILDEAQNLSFNPHLEFFLRETAGPSLKDYGGKLVVAGTVHASCTGFFYKMCHSDRFSHHRWTVLENPMFPRWQGLKNWQEIANKLLFEEWAYEDGFQGPEDPGFLREWRNQWVQSADDCIFTLSREQNIDTRIPSMKKERFRKTMGVDLGWHDQTAFVVWGYDGVENVVYKLDSLGLRHKELDPIMDEMEKFVNKWNPEIVRADSAGAGKIIVETVATEIWNRYKIPVHAADKRDKKAWYNLMNSEGVAGRIKYPSEDDEVYKQMKSILWDKKRERELEGMPCDFVDAGLYGWKDCYPWIKTEKKNELLTKDDELFISAMKGRVSAAKRWDTDGEDDQFEDIFGGY